MIPRSVMSNIASGITGGLLVLGANTIAHATDHAAQTISAKEFKLVDDNGKNLGLWHVLPGGEVTFELYSVNDTKPALFLLAGTKGNSTVSVGTGCTAAINTSKDSAAFQANHGEKQVAMAIVGDESRVEVIGPKSSVRVVGPRNINRAVMGHMKIANPKNGVDLTSPLSTIQLFDETGKVHWRTP